MREYMRDVLPVQYIPHILVYVVTLFEPTNKSRRSPVNPPQLLHPNAREASEDGTAIVKAAEYKSMNKEDSSIRLKVRERATTLSCLS